MTTNDREGEMPKSLLVKAVGRIENPWSFRRYARRRLEISNWRHSKKSSSSIAMGVDGLKELHLETDDFLDLDWNGDGDPCGPAGEAYRGLICNWCKNTLFDTSHLQLVSFAIGVETHGIVLWLHFF